MNGYFNRYILFGCVLGLTIMALFASYPCYAFKNEPSEDFFGVQWGTDLRKNESMRLLKEHSSTASIFVREDEPFKLGDAKLIRVEYWTYKNRFWKVSIYYDGDKYHEQASRFLFDKYGFPDSSKAYTEPFLTESAMWTGDWIVIHLRNFPKEFNSIPLMDFIYTPILRHIETQ